MADNSNQLKREILVKGDRSFKNITDVISDPMEGKTPSWWLIGLVFSISLMLMLLSAIGYLVWEGVGIWGLNNPVGWGFAIVQLK